MSPSLVQPGDDNLGFVRSLLMARCLDGECYELAIALHRGTGLPMVGLWSATESGDDGIPGTWRHAAVRLPDGRLLDARGPVARESFGQPYGEPEPWDIREIGEADLRAVRPVGDYALASLARLAQAAWPDLPWRGDAFQNRTAAFLVALEALSREHGVWIRAPYPSARPFLALGEGDEAGYRGTVTDDGLGVVFDRVLGD